MPRKRQRKKERIKRRDDLLSFARELVGTWAIQTIDDDRTMRFIDWVSHHMVFVSGLGIFHYRDLSGRFEPMPDTLALKPLPTEDWALLVRLKCDIEALLGLMIQHGLSLVVYSNLTGIKPKQGRLSKVGRGFYVDFGAEGRRKLIKPLLADTMLWIDKCVDEGLFGVDLVELYCQCAPLWRQQLGCLPRVLTDLCLDYVFPDQTEVQRTFELDKLHCREEGHEEDDLQSNK